MMNPPRASSPSPGSPSPRILIRNFPHASQCHLMLATSACGCGPHRALASTRPAGSGESATMRLEHWRLLLVSRETLDFQFKRPRNVAVISKHTRRRAMSAVFVLKTSPSSPQNAADGNVGPRRLAAGNDADVVGGPPPWALQPGLEVHLPTAPFCAPVTSLVD